MSDGGLGKFLLHAHGSEGEDGAEVIEVVGEFFLGAVGPGCGIVGGSGLLEFGDLLAEHGDVGFRFEVNSAFVAVAEGLQGVEISFLEFLAFGPFELAFDFGHGGPNDQHGGVQFLRVFCGEFPGPRVHFFKRFDFVEKHADLGGVLLVVDFDELVDALALAFEFLGELVQFKKGILSFVRYELFDSVFVEVTGRVEGLAVEILAGISVELEGPVSSRAL